VSGWVRDRKASITIAAVILVVALTTRSLPFGPDPKLAAAVGLNLGDLFMRGEVWRLLSSVLFARGLDLPIALVALVLGAGACEKLMGTRSVVFAWLVTAVLGGVAQ
jgi:hypothetical protein